MRNGEGRSRFRLPVLAFLVGAALLLATLTAFAHTFTDATTLTIHRTPSGTLNVGQKVKIYGRLGSKHVACHANKAILLWRKNKGQTAFHHIATTRTTTAGRYHFIRHPRRTARYYTQFRKTKYVVHPHRHVCLGSKSTIIKIPVQ
jgi:hypothetical protein